MSNPIIDVFTVFGAVPPRTTEPGTAKLLASMDRLGVHKALTISTRGIYHSANAGNRETAANCGQSEGKLKGIATLDPRTTSLPSMDGFIALAAFPVAQHWPVHHAAFLGMLATLAQQGVNLPLIVEASRIGDLSQLRGILHASGYKGAVIAQGVTSETISEVIALAPTMPNLFLCTNGMRGIGEIDLAVNTMTSKRVLFGSGSIAFGSLASAVAVVKMCHISDEQKHDVLYGNAQTMFAGGVA